MSRTVISGAVEYSRYSLSYIQIMKISLRNLYQKLIITRKSKNRSIFSLSLKRISYSQTACTEPILPPSFTWWEWFTFNLKCKPIQTNRLSYHLLLPCLPCLAALFTLIPPSFESVKNAPSFRPVITMRKAFCTITLQVNTDTPFSKAKEAESTCEK